MNDSHILFRLGEHTLALPLMAVASVERPGRFTQLPFAAPWLRGVTAVRGAVVSVVDLGRFAGGNAAGLTPGARLLVTRGAGVAAALLVDAVTRITKPAGTAATGIRRADPAPAAMGAPAITAPPPGGPLSSCWRGTVLVDGVAVPIVDPDQLMSAEQFLTYQASGED